jgi:predicted TIM-barrel fold metal-dependent hydrolase
MRRREFVAGGVTLLCGAASGPSFTAAEPTAVRRIERIIDAHCHIFNAADLPIEGFAKKVMVPKSIHTNELLARFAEYPGALEALVHAISVQVKRGAPTWEDEISAIDGFEADPERKATHEWRREEDLRQLRSALRLIWFNSEIFASRDLSLPDGLALEIGIEHVQLFLYQQIHEEFGKPDLAPEEHDILRNIQPSEIDALANELYARDDLLGRYIRWALLYTRYRYELAEELDQLHGKIEQKSRVVLMTPAIVDFSKWLEDEEHVSIAHQVEAMTRLARRKQGPRVHGFVGFCPLRQALYNDGRLAPGESDPMSVVRAAIDQGFIGVKLYPPMGFRAIGNKALSDDRFEEPAYLRSTETGLGRRIGEKLDAALSQLYGWCSAYNVPIMAHTSHSFGPNPDYEDRADPAFWADVLKAGAFPHLRINMAHFGHFNKAVPYNRPADYIEQCWEWTVGRIITSSTEAYAYADISSLGEILKVGSSKKVLECLKAFKARFPDSDERLLYGTDWSMIAQEERFPKLLAAKPFPDIMALFLRAAGYDETQIEKIMFTNAARFLGLSEDERQKFGAKSTRARLERFYSAHNLSPAWMNAFN